MPSKDTVFVTGATGQQGGAVARSLLRQGQGVRVLTRNPSKAESLKSLGAEVVAGNLTDRTSLEASLKGVKKVFLMTTFFEEGMEVEVQQGITLADAVKASGVDHLVYTSVGSAHRNTGIPHFETKWKVEQHIQKLGLPATVIRPVFFMENFATFFQPSSEGILMAPLPPDTKLQIISVKDIGEFGAAAFLRPSEFIGQAIDIAGDELTMPEVAVHFSRTMGHSVQFKQMPDDQAEAALGHDMMLMFRWFNKVGYNVDTTALQKQWGIPLTKFKDLINQAPWAKSA